MLTRWLEEHPGFSLGVSAAMVFTGGIWCASGELWLTLTAIPGVIHTFRSFLRGRDAQREAAG